MLGSPQKGVRQRAVSVATVAALVAIGVISCAAFLSAVLWATGWAVLLPEPVQMLTAWIAAITIGAWVLAVGTWALRESVKCFREWLTDELGRRKELRARPR